MRNDTSLASVETEEDTECQFIRDKLGANLHRMMHVTHGLFITSSPEASGTAALLFYNREPTAAGEINIYEVGLLLKVPRNYVWNLHAMEVTARVIGGLVSFLTHQQPINIAINTDLEYRNIISPGLVCGIQDLDVSVVPGRSYAQVDADAIPPA
jgi:hypothetical protein